MKKFVVMMVLLALSSLCSAAIVNSDDTWVREDNSDSNRNGDDFMNVRTDTDGDDNDVILLKFDLTGQTVAASGNSLNLTWYRDDSSTGKTLSLYGLNETHAGEATWSEDDVTYDNAPGLIPDGMDPTAELGDGHSWDDIRDLDTANLTLLVDNQAYGPQVEGDLYTFIGSALDGFLNADTNGQVTFLIIRGEANTSGNQARFITKEATEFHSEAEVPEGGAGAFLVVPEPATMLLLGLGSLLSIRRRK